MGEWSNGLCGCFSNCGVCIITYFLPCYTAGKVAESVGDSCILCGLVLLVPFANIFFGAQIRGKVRDQKGIEGSFIGDILTFWCCSLCALVQEAGETGAMGGMAAEQSIERQ